MSKIGKCDACGFVHYAADPCPKPLKERTDPVVDAVRADLHRRSQLGLAKYGTPLSANPADHKQKLQHAYEEALDLANYLKWSILELEKNEARLSRMRPTFPHVQDTAGGFVPKHEGYHRIDQPVAYAAGSIMSDSVELVTSLPHDPQCGCADCRRRREKEALDYRV